MKILYPELVYGAIASSGTYTTIRSFTISSLILSH